MFCFSAKAIDEYASLKTKAAESNKAADVDPRLEAIVERMLDKYENLHIPLFLLCGFHIAYLLPSPGVFRMVDINKLLEWQLNVED